MRCSRSVKGFETNYDNSDGERIRFAFPGVLTIDELGQEFRTGLEAYFSAQDFLQPILKFARCGILPQTNHAWQCGHRY
jgi:hypothetical protein